MDFDKIQVSEKTAGEKPAPLRRSGWAPPKCAVLNAPSPGSSRFVPMSLYGDALSPVDTFTYLGVPFDGQGISASSLIAHRTASTLSSMRLLHSMGLNRQGFTLLLSSRLYATFVRPKLEYGLAIIRLLKKDVAELERTQDRCLRMIVSGHSKASTVVLRHITNLPSMMFRADTLVLKYCLRFDRLPHDSLLPLLSSTVQSPSIDRLLLHNCLDGYINIVKLSSLRFFLLHNRN
ncbi:hypothetical protein G6F56_013044 [Rhizopus delemar]|nr:hypothetical protein G6F56_013044 [Rhizopus delemar]